MGIHIPYEIRNQGATKSFPTSQRRYMCYSISYRHRSGCILCLDENETPRQRRTSWREKSSMLWISWAWRQDDSCWGPARTPVALNNLNSCGAPGPPSLASGAQLSGRYPMRPPVLQNMLVSQFICFPVWLDVFQPGLPFGVVNLNCQTQKIRDWRPFAFFYSSISASQLWEICCRTSSQLAWELGKIGF